MSTEERLRQRVEKVVARLEDHVKHGKLTPARAKKARVTLADLVREAGGEKWFVPAVSLVDEPGVPKARFTSIKRRNRKRHGLEGKPGNNPDGNPDQPRDSTGRFVSRDHFGRAIRSAEEELPPRDPFGVREKPDLPERDHFGRRPSGDDEPVERDHFGRRQADNEPVERDGHGRRVREGDDR